MLTFCLDAQVLRESFVSPLNLSNAQPEVLTLSQGLQGVLKLFNPRCSYRAERWLQPDERRILGKFVITIFPTEFIGAPNFRFYFAAVFFLVECAPIDVCTLRRSIKTVRHPGLSRGLTL